MAESAFAFLAQLGFSVEERWVTGGDSFRDGWRLSYLSPLVQVVVQYLDSQFEVHFKRGATSASYLAIDHGLFARRSGFHGNMFPPQKLENAIGRIAKDIREHYGPILIGDEGEWIRIARLEKAGSAAAQLP